VFRLNLHGEKWKKKYIEPYKKGKSVWVTVWAAIWRKNRSDLVRLERDFEAKKQGYTTKSYIALLDEMMPTIWEPGLTFMHGNAPNHSAKKVTIWLQDNAIPSMEWPPYSPDLNLIEHMWFPLKEGVYDLDPAIENCKGLNDKEEILGEALEQSWTLISQDIQDALRRSMKHRVEAVLEAKGWYTKYYAIFPILLHIFKIPAVYFPCNIFNSI
jgi:transposase